jgi:hypothetical protein
MTGSKALLPLRVPELGPSLGRLVAVTTGLGGDRWLDPVRYKLGTRIIECGGEARRLAASGERSATLSAIGPEIWKQAWAEAVGSATEQLVERLDTHMKAEALAVGMGRRHRSRLCFAPHEKRALMARLGSAGAALIPVLDELEIHAKRAFNATGLEPDAVRSWQESLSVAARRLEAAWLALEGVVGTEVAQRLKIADQVARWRRPVWPILIVAVVVLPAVAWLGLVLGGYLEAPDWLNHIWQLVFGG